MRCRNIIIYHIIFFINPIIAILNTSVYTSVYKQSPVTHFLFWHFYFFSSFIFPAIFYPPPLEHNMPWFYANIYNTLIAGYFMLQIDYMPRIQQLSNIQFGFVGSLLSSWFMMFAYITVDLDGYFVISRCAYHVSTFTLLYSFLMTTSYASNVYIDLPSENRKKSKLFFGILHVILGGIIVYLSTRITVQGNLMNSPEDDGLNEFGLPRKPPMTPPGPAPISDDEEEDDGRERIGPKTPPEPAPQSSQESDGEISSDDGELHQSVPQTPAKQTPVVVAKPPPRPQYHHKPRPPPQQSKQRPEVAAKPRHDMSRELSFPHLAMKKSLEMLELNERNGLSITDDQLVDLVIDAIQIDKSLDKLIDKRSEMMREMTEIRDSEFQKIKRIHGRMPRHMQDVIQFDGQNVLISNEPPMMAPHRGGYGPPPPPQWAVPPPPPFTAGPPPPFVAPPTFSAPPPMAAAAPPPMFSMPPPPLAFQAPPPVIAQEYFTPPPSKKPAAINLSNMLTNALKAQICQVQTSASTTSTPTKQSVPSLMSINIPGPSGSH
ncbi:hypothetical protein CRE_13924 [Caenorhabditis remanei]|uniref:Uncharacterized protein n=1 Tax=Caenorhabditis remanei TaxID=31234 RepID=E3M8R6_CAERE|nr:hypothetical protein CRE_13924 [Caenorhabditis remanei]